MRSRHVALLRRLAPLLLATAAGGCASGAMNEFRDGTPGTDVGPAAERSSDAGADAVVLPDVGLSDLPQTPDGPAPDGPAPDIAADLPAPPPDTVPADTTPADLDPSLPNVGAICVDDTPCTNGAQCLLKISSTVGICTMTCTQDDPATSGNEDSCPDTNHHVCAEIPLSDGSSQYYCLQRCEPKETANDCPPELACDPTSTLFTEQRAAAACVFPACQTDADCPVSTDGTCDPATLTGCSAGETCVAYSATSAVCTLPGKCLPQSGLCGTHTQGSAAATVGSPCTADTDCGNGMICLEESSSGSEVVRRNGYCSRSGCAFGALSFATCPAGSACSHLYLAGLCLRSCTLQDASSCRGVSGDLLGDYECYAWDQLAIAGTQVAATPVCDSPLPCDLIACSSLGVPTTNSTNMSCRDPATNITTTITTTPGTYCLDETASGPLP